MHRPPPRRWRRSCGRCSAIRRRCASSSGTASALGPTDGRRHAAGCARRTPSADCCGAPTSSAWRGRTSPASSMPTATSSSSSAALRAALPDDVRVGRRGTCRRRCGPRAASACSAGRCRRRREEARLHGGRHSLRRDAAAIQPPLRRRQRLLPPRARAVDDVLVRPLRRRRRSTSTTAQALKHDLICRKLGLDDHDRRAPARRRVRVGVDGDPRRQPLRRLGRRHHDQRGPGRARPASGSPTPASPTGSRSGCRTTATSAASSSTRSRRSACPSTSATQNLDRYFELLRGALRPTGRLLNHAISKVGGSKLGAHVVHRPLRVPRRRADRRRRERAVDGAGRLRGARRRVAARALRPHAAGVGRQPGGRRGTRRCALVGVGAGAGVAAVHGRRRRSAFADGEIAIHQVLGVVPTADGAAACPPASSGAVDAASPGRRFARNGQVAMICGDVGRVDVLVEAGDPAVGDAHDDARRHLDALTGPVRRHEDVLLHEAVVGGRAADLGVAPCRAGWW